MDCEKNRAHRGGEERKLKPPHQQHQEYGVEDVQWLQGRYVRRKPKAKPLPHQLEEQHADGPEIVKEHLGNQQRLEEIASAQRLGKRQIVDRIGLKITLVGAAIGDSEQQQRGQRQNGRKQTTPPAG